MKIVLIIDDDVINLMLMHEFLKDMYKIKVAPDPDRGLELASMYPNPDIIFSDLMFDKYSGEDIYLALQSNAKTRNIPIVFISNEEPDSRVIGTKWTILRKPIDRTALINEIELVAGVKQINRHDN